MKSALQICNGLIQDTEQKKAYTISSSFILNYYHFERYDSSSFLKQKINIDP